MERQQMTELLLARMDANTKAMQEKTDANLKELKDDVKTNQAKMDVNLKEMREEIHSIWSELEEKRICRAGSRLREDDGRAES
jgi:translation elongation factor EF-1beta